MEIITIENKKDEKFLRQKTADFDFVKFKKPEIRALIKTMRKIMKNANGIGLSANQIGLNTKVFVAQAPSEKGGSKFYTIFNPKITKVSGETVELEEGCLSVPDKWGLVTRPEKIILEGLDINGKNIKIKAWGPLARVFQHEIDHLNGKLFIDRTKKITTLRRNQ